MNPNPLPDPVTPADFVATMARAQCLALNRNYSLEKSVRCTCLVTRMKSFTSGMTSASTWRISSLNIATESSQSTPKWSQVVLLEKVRKTVASRSDWGFSEGEVQWMVTKLKLSK